MDSSLLSTFPVQTQEFLPGTLVLPGNVVPDGDIVAVLCLKGTPGANDNRDIVLVAVGDREAADHLVAPGDEPDDDGQAPSEAAGGVAATVPGTYSSCLTSREGPTPPIGKALGPKKPGAVWVVVASSCQAGASASWA